MNKSKLWPKNSHINWSSIEEPDPTTTMMKPSANTISPLRNLWIKSLKNTKPNSSEIYILAWKPLKAPTVKLSSMNKKYSPVTKPWNSQTLPKDKLSINSSFKFHKSKTILKKPNFCLKSIKIMKKFIKRYSSSIVDLGIIMSPKLK